jgi:radical SAM protein with 4Fe4S-binding SPASM domain
MVPKIGNSSMSAETFEKMLFVTEKLFEKGDYGNASFRLSGGEPFLVWKNYADLVTKYKNKHKQKMYFGILSNLTVLTDDMIEWMKKNFIGIQVSLDNLERSKPLNNGEGSVPLVLKNVQRLREAKIDFSINTVFEYEQTKSLRKLVDYVCSVNSPNWGLSASYTFNDDTCVEDVIDAMKLAVLRLRDNGFDVKNRFRFYNEVIGQPGTTCTAGVSIFALGTNLKVWPCQSMIDKKPLGYFDENLKTLLQTSEDNKYFRDRTLLPQCTDCSILNWCRGGCRAVHLSDMKAVDLTCRIKQEIIPFIIKETEHYSYRQRSNCNCDNQADGNLDNMIKDYITSMPKAEIKPMFVETPALPAD